MSDLRERCEEFLKGVTFFDADESVRKFYLDAVMDFAREMRIEGMEKAKAAIRDHITELHNTEDTKIITRQVQAAEAFRCIAIIEAEIQREKEERQP